MSDEKSQWFVEEMDPTGTFVPAVYHGDRPTEKRIGGHRRQFRAAPVKINEGHIGLPLTHLVDLYGADGKFRAC